MRQTLIAFAAAACCAFAGTAGAAMAKAEYKTEKTRIQADYKAAKERCGALKDNAKDICKVEAKGNYEVAKAELEAQYEPSVRHDTKVKTAKADAAYELAKEKCDDMTGDAKGACKKDAKAAFVSAKADAKASKQKTS
jgi:hypothetical protein